MVQGDWGKPPRCSVLFHDSDQLSFNCSLAVLVQTSRVNGRPCWWCKIIRNFSRSKLFRFKKKKFAGIHDSVVVLLYIVNQRNRSIFTSESYSFKSLFNLLSVSILSADLVDIHFRCLEFVKREKELTQKVRSTTDMVSVSHSFVKNGQWWRGYVWNFGHLARKSNWK